MITHHHQRLLRGSCTTAKASPRPAWKSSRLHRVLPGRALHRHQRWWRLTLTLWPLALCLYLLSRWHHFGSLETPVTKVHESHSPKLLSVPSILQLEHEYGGRKPGVICEWVLSAHQFFPGQEAGAGRSQQPFPAAQRLQSHYLATWRKSLFTPVPSLEASPSSTTMDKRRKCVLETSLVV